MIAGGWDMLIDLEKCDNSLVEDCDVAVIGAGAVGLVIGVTLARLGLRVVVLEGGGVGIESRSQDLMRGKTIGHPFRHIDIGRYRVLGGSTTFWGGQIMPFDEAVFKRRPCVSGAGWPFGREVLDPYYARAYKLLGLDDTELDDGKIWSAVGAQPPHFGPDLELTLSRWVPKRNFARLFQHEINQNTNLFVTVHANVTGLSLNEAGNHVTAVHSRTLGGRNLVVKPRFTVAACGTLEIVRLLRLPSVNGRACPWHRNPWLGRGFIDHLDSIAGTVEVLDYDRFHSIFDSIYLGGRKYYPKLRLSSKSQLKYDLLDIGAQFLFDTIYTEHLNNIKMFLRSIADGRMPSDVKTIPGHVIAVAKVAVPLAVRYVKAHRSFKPRGAKVRLALYGEQIPCRRSEILLSSEIDALGLPRVMVNWTVDGQELKTIAWFAKALSKTLSDNNLARISLDPLLEAEDPAFLQRIGDAIHQMSGARIGVSPEEGVVSPSLRVYGTDNLYVAGAATFPTSGFANPTFTAIALGLRLCDHLSGKADHA
jgi:hypothetical protein